ncbi:MAG: hypothetical protein EOO38_10730 [Cytophagaceae bacterium]|nr:MAG: hypothetical protein EOO38_10730 [Cytophagaceae bacterium]
MESTISDASRFQSFSPSALDRRSSDRRVRPDGDSLYYDASGSRGAPSDFYRARMERSPAICALSDQSQKRIAATYAVAALGFATTTGIALVAGPALLAVTPGVLLGISIGSCTASFVSAITLPRATPHSLTEKIAWGTLVASFGVLLAVPAALLGSTIVLQAAIITVGVTAAMSLFAYLAPTNTFARLGAPLLAGMVGLTGVGLASLVMPAAWPITAALHTVDIYGGIALFAAYIGFDAQVVASNAEAMSDQDFSAPQQSAGLYIHMINISTRLMEALAQNKKR